jgi:Flp pilus assembly protein TadG
MTDRRRSTEAGQASVELVAAALALVIGGLAAFQVLAAGHAASVADNAAEAGALALVNGGDPEAAARAAAPPWARRGLRVSRQAGQVRVSLQAPAALRLLPGHFEATAHAVVRRPGESGGR